LQNARKHGLQILQFSFILKRSAECDDLDASLLLLKIVGFPVSDEVYRASTEAIQRDLCHLSHEDMISTAPVMEANEAEKNRC
jgi:hypothetical protein